MATGFDFLLPDSRLSLRESSATFAERKATVFKPGAIGLTRPGSPVFLVVGEDSMTPLRHVLNSYWRNTALRWLAVDSRIISPA
jgi:hypothetical protein